MLSRIQCLILLSLEQPSKLSRFQQLLPHFKHNRRALSSKIFHNNKQTLLLISFTSNNLPQSCQANNQPLPSILPPLKSSSPNTSIVPLNLTCLVFHKVNLLVDNLNNMVEAVIITTSKVLN